MKEITKERTKVEKYVVYQAVDGTEFITQEECQKYDNSALGVIRGKIKNLTVGEPKDAWVTMGGYDDHSVIAIKPRTEADVELIMQWIYLENPYYLNEAYNGNVKNLKDTALKALKGNDVILMGINCEKEYYFINSRQNIIDNLMALDKKEEEK